MISELEILWVAAPALIFMIVAMTEDFAAVRRARFCHIAVLVRLERPFGDRWMDQGEGSSMMALEQEVIAWAGCSPDA